MTSYAEGIRINAARAVGEQRIRLTHLQNAQARGEDVGADIDVTAARLGAAVAGARWLNMSDAERTKERAQ